MDRAYINKGWDNPLGDDHSNKQRSQADHTTKAGQRIFFDMIRGIGGELDCATSALTLESAHGEHSIILDLCMAPGGFAASVLDVNNDAAVRGIN